LRSTFQAGHIWGQADQREIIAPSPSECGRWLDNDSYKVTWSTLPEIVDTCKELIKCVCSKTVKRIVAVRKVNCLAQYYANARTNVKNEPKN